MGLSDRKKKILQIVVDDYIQTAVPVSSKAITSKYLTDISSATVRSELSALEELGYLSQPHTSAGRIPSGKAYKLYVTELMQKDKKLTKNELDYIKSVFLQKTDNIETVLKSATKVISELTSYTTLAVSSHEANDRLVNVKLFRVKADSALLIILTDTKIFKDNFIDLPSDMTDEQLEETNKILARFCEGKTIEEFCDTELELEDSFLGFKNIFLNVINALKEYIEHSECYTEGEDKILSHPEYADVEKIRNFLSVVTDKDKVFNIMSGEDKDIKVNIKVGSEGYENIPEGCSLVTATYHAGGVKLGTYGVIGPERMDYKKVVAVIEHVGQIIESILKNRWEMEEVKNQEELQENTQQEENKIESLSQEELVELVKSLQQENQALIEETKKAEEYKDNWLRARADFENFKKRNNETRRIAYEDGKNDVIKSILLIGDNLDRALLTIKDEQTKKGMEMVVKQFSETLKNIGVEEINPVGQKFDPNFAEAVMQVDAEEGEESETIKQVFLKGYSANGKIIRYAQVVVIK